MARVWYSHLLFHAIPSRQPVIAYEFIESTQRVSPEVAIGTIHSVRFISNVYKQQLSGLVEFLKKISNGLVFLKN